MATHLYVYLLLSLTSLNSISAVQFIVKNDVPKTPGGMRFTKEAGVDFTKKAMETTSNFIWKMFEERNVSDRKQFDLVTTRIANLSGLYAVTSGNLTNITAELVKAYKGELKKELTAILYHEMTHVWQRFGGENYKARIGLIEGIADYTVLRALGSYPTDGFAKRGEGDKWDQGYAITARFLEYCDGIRSGFVAALNKKLKVGYSDNYFRQLLGKPVEVLWKEYKAKYKPAVAK